MSTTKPYLPEPKYRVRYWIYKGARIVCSSVLSLMIVAVVAGMALPRLLSNTSSGPAPAQGDLSMISKQLSIFKLDTGRYPTTQEGLAALVDQPSNASGWRGPYLDKRVPNDPWGHPYVYQNPSPTNPNNFLLESYGPTGQPGAQDAIVESQ